uniref:Uncharacterized protein n=1 Tax=Macrostomum lignano TaxID=282301 RepID=A0A1I8HES8_9PLAT
MSTYSEIDEEKLSLSDMPDELLKKVRWICRINWQLPEGRPVSRIGEAVPARNCQLQRAASNAKHQFWLRVAQDSVANGRWRKVKQGSHSTTNVQVHSTSCWRKSTNARPVVADAAAAAAAATTSAATAAAAS